MKKKQKITSTDKANFFTTLKCAAVTPDPTNRQTPEAETIAGYSDKQTRSHSSASAVSRRG